MVVQKNARNLVIWGLEASPPHFHPFNPMTQESSKIQIRNSSRFYSLVFIGCLNYWKGKSNFYVRSRIETPHIFLCWHSAKAKEICKTIKVVLEFWFGHPKCQFLWSKNRHFCQKCPSLRPKKWHFEWPNQNSKTTFIVQTFPKYGL